ncbi:Uncharacterised protein [Klebsiella pneumoniae]|nr:Uncharacterised protein [Klebsiella pneumoniae]
MQNVEHAVGHHHFLAALARLGDFSNQLCFIHHAKAGFRARMNGVLQLNRGNRRGPQFTDHHARRGIRQEAALFQRIACRQRGRQYANHRITGTGNVEHFLRLGWHMERLFARLQQRHTVLGTRDQQRRQAVLLHQCRAALDDIRFAFTFAHHRFELGEVWRQQRCTVIT